METTPPKTNYPTVSTIIQESLLNDEQAHSDFVGNRYREFMAEQAAKETKQVTDDVSNSESYFDSGVWTVGVEKTDKVFIESSDFTHDVRLYVNGDFANVEQKQKYARSIARRLNETRNTQPT